MAQMSYRSYTAYNVLGAVLWIWSMLFIGYFLGRFIPGVDQHIEKVILLVIFVSLLPGLISWWRERNRPAADSSVRPTTDA
jgi:membrane-associated protein